MDHAINESSNKVTILPMSYREMTISFVKFHDKKIWEPQHVSVL